jgi:hypothetical protein
MIKLSVCFSGNFWLGKQSAAQNETSTGESEVTFMYPLQALLNLRGDELPSCSHVPEAQISVVSRIDVYMVVMESLCGQAKIMVAIRLLKF